MEDNPPYFNRRNFHGQPHGHSIPRQDSFGLQQVGVNVGASGHSRNWSDPASIAGDNDPSCLSAILEDALELALSIHGEEEIQNRRETVEHTWEQVRQWLESHPDPNDRAEAACFRGQADATPLHLICKLGDPPSDIISDLIAAAPETVRWTDNSLWLPLHYACDKIVSSEVLKILADAFPDGKTFQDRNKYTPLRLYLTHKADNPDDMANIVAILSDSGAAELPDRAGMLPMHIACAYGAPPQVLNVLAEAYPDSLTAKGEKGRTPMHLIMVNAHQDGSPGVMRFLLASQSVSTINMRDQDGCLPLQLLAMGLAGHKSHNEAQREEVSVCLSLYLDALNDKLAAPFDFLTALTDLPDWLQDVAAVSPNVRSILNKKIVQRLPTSILMLDGYFLLIIIVCFELATHNHIDLLFKTNDEDTSQSCLVVLFFGGSYFLLRELIQIMSLWSLGSLSSWFFDMSNWLDCAVIFVVIYFTTLMAAMTTGVSPGTFRKGVAVSKGILWCAVIDYLKNTRIDFAVFVGGVFYVVKRLVAFLLVVFIILLAFAQMFYIVYIRSPICTKFNSTQIETLQENGDNFNICYFAHCTFEESLFRVYGMILGEIGDETRYYESVVAQIIYVAYAFLVVILLSNVLVAIITDSYEIIQNERAAIVFWTNRLGFLAEMDAIDHGIRSHLCSRRGDHHGNAPDDDDNDHVGELAAKESHRIMREGWSEIIRLFDFSFYEQVLAGEESQLKFWYYTCLRIVAVIIVIPSWLLLGAATAGWLWPPQVREYLFIQHDTARSRSEQTLEQLQQIQANMASLKEELQIEIAVNRKNIKRWDAEVEAAQKELLLELYEVRTSMDTVIGMSRDRF